MEYEPVIGLEVHVHLKTKTKSFCGCSTEFGNKPNTQTCPVCLGLPGVLPVYNRKALDYAIKVGLALNCKIQEFTKFDRKNYFYPDLPKNFQISQYDEPLAVDGFLDIEAEGKSKRVNILRVHMEEDAGKLIHKDNLSLVDYNRAGMPLLEIVTQPDLHSPAEAYEYLVFLKSIIEYLGVSDCNMEKGSLRCDANISMREKGIQTLGTKAELKNLNSFKAVKDALASEISRQTACLEDGGLVIQETRLWDAKKAETVTMRSKEEAKDYRYFPEPDLPPFTISKDKITAIKETIPELPKEKQRRFRQEYGLSAYDAGVLVASKTDADYAERCIRAYPGKEKKAIVNWLIGPLFSEANGRNCSISDLNIPVQDMVSLVTSVEKQEISNLSGKSVLSEMIASKVSPEAIMKEKNLIQISQISE